jgi:hypothetical protein
MAKRRGLAAVVDELLLHTHTEREGAEKNEPRIRCRRSLSTDGSAAPSQIAMVAALSSPRSGWPEEAGGSGGLNATLRLGDGGLDAKEVILRHGK